MEFSAETLGNGDSWVLEEECAIAIPTSRGAGTVSYVRLWPGQTAQATGDEVIGARSDFEDGDLARFVIFRTAGRSPDWGMAVVSHSFSINADALHGLDVRTKH